MVFVWRGWTLHFGAPFLRLGVVVVVDSCGSSVLGKTCFVSWDETNGLHFCGVLCQDRKRTDRTLFCQLVFIRDKWWLVGVWDRQAWLDCAGTGGWWQAFCWFWNMFGFGRTPAFPTRLL